MSGFRFKPYAYAYRDVPDDKIKASHNHALLELALTTFGSGRHHVINLLTLDAEFMNTSRTFAKAATNIIVPERDPVTYSAMRKRRSLNMHLRSKCILFNGELSALLRSRKHVDVLKIVNCVYFDFMGTVSGCESRNIFPLQDIDDFLRINESRTLVMAFTFSRRWKAMPYNDRPGDEQMWDMFLAPLFQWHKLAVDSYKAETYYRDSSMVTFFVVAHKDMRVKAHEAEFFIGNGKHFIGYPK